MLATNEEDKSAWKESFEEALCTRNLKETGLSFQADAPLTLDKIKVHMRKSNLFLLPLLPLFRTMVEDEPVVYRNKLELNAETWKDRIIQQLVKPEESHRSAKRLREQLLLDTSIVQTHMAFINTIAGI